MTVNYRIDHEKKTVFTTIDGAITDEEMIAIQNRMEADPEFNPDYSHLIDCRKVGELKISAKGIRIITSAGLFSAKSRRAFVVPNDAAYGFSRMFQIYRQEGPEETGVFRELDAAMKWIGLE
jgi:hypothetical protein